MRKLLLFFALVLCFTTLMSGAYAATPNPGHDASSIGPGAFSVGNFTFNGSLLVTNATNTTLLYVNSTNGFIGIGTKSPTRPLEITMDAASGTSSKFAGSYGARSGMLISGDGTIYETDLGYRFNLLSTSAVGGSIGGFARAAVTSGGIYAGMEVGTDSNAPLRFVTNGGSNSQQGERIRITSAGLVGINTTTPTQALDVNGNINISNSSASMYTPRLCLNGDCQTSWPNTNITGSYTTGYVPLATNATNLGNSALYQSGSNIGIGTTTLSQELTVNGDINASGNVYVGDGTVTSPSISFGTYPGTGFYGYNLGAGQVGMAIYGTLYTRWTQLGTVNAVPFYGPGDGTASVPSFSFNGDSDTGLYSGGVNTINISVGGLSIVSINGSGINITNSSGSIYTPQLCLNNDCRTSWPSLSGISSAGGWTNTTTNVSLSNSANNVSAGTLFVDNTNGRVGINTTTPTQTLDVNGSINVSNSSASIYTPQLCLNGNCQTSWPSGGNATASLRANYVPYATNASQIANSTLFYNVTTERFGVNTSAPTAAFHVSGVLKVGNVASPYSEGVIVLGDGGRDTNFVGLFRSQVPFGGGNGYLTVAAQDGVIFTTGQTTIGSQTERVRVEGNGRLGINTTTPTQALDVNGNINISNSSGILYTPQLCLNNDCRTAWPNTNITGSYTAGYVPYAANSTNLVNSIITQSSGRIGINTTQPSAALHINGSGTEMVYIESSTTPALQLYNYNANADMTSGTQEGGLQFGGYHGGSYNPNAQETSRVVGIYLGDGTTRTGGLAFQTGNGGNPTEKVRIDSTGNVGIGTSTPNATLTINSSSNDGSFLVQNTSGNVSIFVNGTNARVGIGTTRPSTPLDVNGTIKATGVNLNNGYITNAYIAQNNWARNVLGSANGIAMSTNRLFGATNGRYTVTTSGTAISDVLFDGLYDSGTTISGNTTGSYTIDFNPQSGWFADAANGFVYNNGILALSWYNTGYPSNVTIEVYKFNGVSDAWTNIYNTSTNIANPLVIPTSAMGNYVKRIRINMSAENDVSPTEMEWFPARESLQNQFTSIPLDTNGTIDAGIGTLNFKNINWTTTAQIKSDGNAYFANGSGNVGIGTTSPSAKLHVAGSAPEIFLEHTGGDDLTMSTSDGSGLAGIKSSGKLSIGYGGQDTIMQRAGGNVGIGTTQPNNTLTVMGSGNFTGVLYASNISSNSPLNLMTQGTTRIYVNDTTGNVGIGTTTPAQKLDVGGNIRINGGNYLIEFGDGSSNIQRVSNDLVFNTSDGFNFSGNIQLPATSSITFGRSYNTGTLSFFNGVTAVASINAANGFVSNVNFNTADGTVNAPGFGFSGQAGVGAYRPASNTLGLVTTSLERVRIDASGNVGIGTSETNHRLVVEDSSGNLLNLSRPALGSYYQDISGGGADTMLLSFVANNAGAGYEFSSRNSGGTVVNNALRIDRNGNVGIGEEAPQERLVVAGNIMLNTSINTTNYITVPLSEQLGLQFGTISHPEYGRLSTTYSVQGGGYVNVTYGGAGVYQYDSYGSIFHMGYSGISFTNSGGSDGTSPLTITSNAGQAVSVLALNANNKVYQKFDNQNGGNLYIGVENGTNAAQIFTGTSISSAVIGTDNENMLEFATNGISQMAINKSGSVLIGGKTPGSGYKLAVTDDNGVNVRLIASDGGRAALTTTSNGHISWDIGTNADSSWSLKQNGGNDYIAVKSDGSTGIGTMWPNATLGVAGNFSTTKSAYLATTSGNVGIGTNAPNNTLTVLTNTATYAVNISNIGNNANRYGISMQAGADDGSGDTYYLTAMDGNGDITGYVRSSSGTFQLVDVSDRATKVGIKKRDFDALSKVNSVDVVEYTRKQNPNGTKITGFVAQDLQAIYPEAVSVGPDGKLGVSKAELVPLLFKALQEQQVQINALAQGQGLPRGHGNGQNQANSTNGTNTTTPTIPQNNLITQSGNDIIRQLGTSNDVVMTLG